MIRRGWIESSNNIAVLEARVCKFLQIATIDDTPEPLPHAARKSTAYGEPPSPSQIAWLYRARQLARAVQVAPYSGQRLSEVVSSLRRLSHVPQEARHVARVLSDAGIKFIVVQPLPGSRIDGACLWDGDTPIIALSLRFDRIDNFWFVLFHELDHVSKGVESCDSDIESPGDDAGRPQREIEANAFAAETLIPSTMLESFIARVGPFYRADRIEAFAQTAQVHPAIVVGQLQHRKGVTYSSFRKMLAPIREWITSSALTDGWGATLPALP
jgi:HTH-type transcriptional regulator/antitoxin HigA